MFPTAASRWLVALALACACGDNKPGFMPGDAGTDSPADAAPDAANLPDLTIHRARAEADLAIGVRDFAADSCELDVDEACIGGPGPRRLLYFSVETPNVGDADMVLGMPNPENDAFEYSACHDHFHFNGYAAYELINIDLETIAVGRKQAFCLLDVTIFDVEDPTVSQTPRFSCGFQGIQRGWADTYQSTLPCQFLDITDIADGDYTLRVELNRERGLEESSYDNNRAEIPIRIGDAALEGPTEACLSTTSARALESVNRECGWTSQEIITCTPGIDVSVGCSQNCGAFSLGECTGDPMLRVCDATRSDGNCSHPGALGSRDDACGDNCPIVFDTVCPASGMLEVFSGSFSPDQAYTCDLEVVEG